MNFLINFVFCFAFFQCTYIFPALESLSEASNALFYMQSADEQDIPKFIENYAFFAGEQSVKAGWFSNESQAFSAFMEEQYNILNALKNPYLYEGIYTEWKEKNFLFYIYVFNESIPCGYFWYCTEDQEAFIQAIFIEPEYCGRGIGTTILNNLAIELKEKGYHCIDIHVFTHNTSAYNLYKRLGFKEILFGPEHAVSSFYMTKKLQE